MVILASAASLGKVKLTHEVVVDVEVSTNNRLNAVKIILYLNQNLELTVVINYS